MTPIADDGGVVRAGRSLMAEAAVVATATSLSIYDAAYVTAARASGARLVSCNLRGLVSKRLAQVPAEAG